MGFKVVAIDVAGHGGTQGLPTDGARIDAYVDLLRRVLDELGIRRAVFAGHSMGGRLVAQLAAEDPDRAIAVILIDAAVGELLGPADQRVALRPARADGVAVLLAMDTLSTLPWLRDPPPGRQARAGWSAPPSSATPPGPWRLLGRPSR